MVDLAKRLLFSRHVWRGLALVAIFWTAAAYLSFEALNVLVRCVTLFVSVAVLVAYGRWGIVALTRKRISRGYQLLLGITLSWLGSLLLSAYIVWWRARGVPGESISSDIATFGAFLTTIGGVLHITAPGAFEEKVPPRNWIMLGLAVAAGVTLAWVLIVTSLGG